ncbi:MAG: hypothetical protein KA791_11000 [Flavobacteriales bacterium]|nr:hypothetical protein [Flavobacteriales bacterium]
MMRFFSPLVCAVLLAACARPSTETTTTTAKDTTVAPVEAPRVAHTWHGCYTGNFPMAGGKHIQVDLWVRKDSTYIIQQLREGDTLREGWIGQWHVVYAQGGPAGGLMTIGYAGDKPDFYLYTEKGLVMADEMGVAAENQQDWTLEKLADEMGDAIPRMKLMGTFTYMADAQSFQPCGAKFSWPCAGGMDMGEEEGEPLVKFDNADLQKLYRKAVKNGGDPWTIEAICIMGMGPAREGDGADEYVYIEEVKRTLDRCP